MLKRYRRWLLPVGILTLLLGASLATARRSAPPPQSTLQGTSSDVTLDMRLNEVLAFPPAGQQEWIELINLSDEVIMLQGWTLDDVEGAGSAPFILDGSPRIGPGALLRIDTPNMYANFGSEAVRLVSPAGTEVDRFDFNGPERGLSFARIPDGLGPWFANRVPTPGASNTPVPTPSDTEIPTEIATPSQTVTATETTTPSPTVTEPEPEPTTSATLTPSETILAATPTDTSVAPTPTETSADPTPTETSSDPTFTEIVVATPTETASPSPTLEDATPGDTVTTTSTPDGTVTETLTPTDAAIETATPTVTAMPTAIVQSDIRLNEIVAVPGAADAYGWIEFYNLGTRNYDLTGWILRAASGAEGTIGMGAILGPGEWLVLDLPTGFVLAADTITLSTEDDQEVDRFSFESSIPGRSWSRVPDGTGDWLGDRRPTRGTTNSRDDTEPGTPTIVLTPTKLPTLTPSITQTRVPSSTHTPTRTPTTTLTRTLAPTRTPTQTRTIRPTPTASSTRTQVPTRTPLYASS